MPNTIHIPTPLRPFTDKKESVEVDGKTVGELLADLTTRYDGLRKHLYADDGRLRNFVNVYLNDEDVRYHSKQHSRDTIVARERRHERADQSATGAEHLDQGRRFIAIDVENRELV